MSAPMRFRGQLCFRDANHLARALAVLDAAPDSVVRKDSAERVHLMLDVDVDMSAPAGMWSPTCLALGRAAEHAHSGMIVCEYGEEPERESDVVLAENWKPAPAGPGKPGFVNRVRRWFGGESKGRRAASRWWQGHRRTTPPRRLEFAFEDCEVLVIYALGDHASEPEPALSSFVVGIPPIRLPGGLDSDIAPYFMEYYRPHLEKDLNRAVAETKGDGGLHEALLEALAWTYEQGGQGFAVQLEPPAMAGDGRARRLGLEAEERGSRSVFSGGGGGAGGGTETGAGTGAGGETGAETEGEGEGPWESGAGGYVCPACGSTDTRSTYTSALGDRFVEARCEACEHYGSWFDRGFLASAEDVDDDDDGEGEDAGRVAPPDPVWIEIPAGSFDLGLTDDEVDALARDSAAVANLRAEHDPDQLHGFREAAELGSFAGNADYLSRTLAKALPRSTVEHNAFAIARDPVTVGEYKAFLEATGHPPPDRWSRGMPRRLDMPVSDVSWHDAAAFATWAGFRLPREVEWARAARGVERRLYPWGDTYGDLGQWMDDQDWVWRWPVTKAPALASPDGVFDMVTRHWEWCADRFAPYPGADLEALQALWPDYPDYKDDARVLRGAEGEHIVACCVARVGVAPSMAVMGGKFRLARDL